ncbi:MAG: LamG-like jellyroll fold domain-containing protein [Bacteroidota bacterium]
MRQLKPRFFLFYLLLFTLLTPLRAQHQCAFDELHQKRLSEDPDYARRLWQVERKTQSWLTSPAANNRSGTVYTIPVVVHILHLGESVGTGTNISDAQIISAIDRMTDVYRNNDGVSDGYDTGIEFCLADVTPDCQSTTGIVRVDATSVSGYSTMGIQGGTTDGSDEVETKDLSRWNPEEYLNIWVVSEINNNNGGSGTQGYSRLPAGAPYDYDGVVILYNAMGYDPTGSLGYELKSYTRSNATLIHEAAHYLDIYHTFEGDSDGTTCPSNSDCSTDGDRVCDTDPHIRSASNCPSGTNSCTGSSNADIVDNYMDYSSQTCKTRFTAGQAARMQAALNTQRIPLWDSQGCSGVTSQPVAASCSPTTTTPHSTAGIGIEAITIGDLVTSSGNSYEDGGYLDRSCRNFTVDPNTTVSISVANGSSNPENVRIYVDYDNDGVMTDAGESVFYSTNATTHSGSFTIPEYPTVTGTPIRVRILSDFVNFEITSPCQDMVYGQVEDFSMTINPLDPTIIASITELNDFTTSTDAASSSQSFTVSGDELKDDVSLNVSGSAYELSTDDTNFSSSLTLSHDGYELDGEPVTVYVRLKTGMSGSSYSETITLSSTDATNATIDLSGKVVDTDEVRGNALTFDNNGDFVLTTFTGISGTESRTFEAWVKTTSTEADAIMGYGANSTAQKWVVRTDGGQLRIEVNGGYKRGTTSINDGVWHHIAVVLDNSGGATLNNTTLYVDGVVESISGSSNTSTTLNTASSQGMWIGYDHSSRYFDGEIEEVRVWNVARTVAQVRETMHLTLNGLETGLVAYYQMNEASGSTTKDGVGGADGTLNGDASFTASSLAVAGGSCSTLTLGSDGNGGVEVNANNLQIDFANSAGSAPNGDLMIYMLEESAYNGPTYDDQGDRYWVVRNFGSNQNSLDVESMTLTLPSGDALLSAGTSELSLHKRGSGESGDWLEMASSATSVDGGSGEVVFDGLTGFNSFSQVVVGRGVALPVEWVSFDALRLNSRTVQLAWATATEIDNAGFEIQYSYDGRTFEKAVFIKGQGHSTQFSSYTHQLPEPQAAYYRLKQMDNNGDFDYSIIRYVEGGAQMPDVQVIPNPSSGEFQLFVNELDPEEVLQLNLIDLQGRQLLHTSGTLDQLNERLRLQQDQLPKGVLMLQLSSKSGVIMRMSMTIVRV